MASNAEIRFLPALSVRGFSVRLIGRLLLALALGCVSAGGANAEETAPAVAVSAGAGDAGQAAGPAHPHHVAHGLRFKQAEVYRGFQRVGPSRGFMVPAAADLSAFFPPPRNQGDQNSCVGWSVGYALRGYYANRAAGHSGNQAAVLLSPSFVYNLIADPGECDTGSNISDALDLLRDVGTVPITRFPYRDSDCNRRPGPDVKREAGAWRIRGWHTVDLTGPAAVKEQIAKGDPVVIGMYVTDAFTELAGDTVFRDTGKDGDGHAMVVVGYDDRKRAFRLMNSWGPEWGRGGFGWVSYDSFAARVDEAYVATVADLPPLPANGIAPPAGDVTAPSGDIPAPAPSVQPKVQPDEPVPGPGADDGVPPELSANGRQAFQNYRNARTHKAFALAPDGAYGWRSGRTSTDIAADQALAFCRQHTSGSCRVVSLDDQAQGNGGDTPSDDVPPSTKYRPQADEDGPSSDRRHTGPVEIPGIRGDSEDDN